MKLGTLPFSELLTYSEDIYENTIITAKRARQIINDRALKRSDELEMLMEEYTPTMVADIDDYVEHPKPIVTAVEELFNGDLEWGSNEIIESEDEK